MVARLVHNCSKAWGQNISNINIILGRFFIIWFSEHARTRAEANMPAPIMHLVECDYQLLPITLDQTLRKLKEPLLLFWQKSFLWGSDSIHPLFFVCFIYVQWLCMELYWWDFKNSCPDLKAIGQHKEFVSFTVGLCTSNNMKSKNKLVLI